MIETAGSEEQKQRWLPGIASGAGRGAAELDHDGGAIVGAAAGSVVLALAEGEGAKLVETADATLEPLDLIDSTRAYYRVEADGGDPLPGDDRRSRLGRPGGASRPSSSASPSGRWRWRSTTPRSAISSSARSAPTRRSRTGCAEMLWDVEEARSLTYYAAWCADAAAGVAAARGLDGQGAGLRSAAWSTHDAIQVLGGIGFTWEHDLHFLLKRARVGARLMGPAQQHREQVAALVGLG